MAFPVLVIFPSLPSVLLVPFRQLAFAGGCFLCCEWRKKYAGVAYVFSGQDDTTVPSATLHVHVHISIFVSILLSVVARGCFHCAYYALRFCRVHYRRKVRINRGVLDV